MDKFNELEDSIRSAVCDHNRSEIVADLIDNSSVELTPLTISLLIETAFMAGRKSGKEALKKRINSL